MSFAGPRHSKPTKPPNSMPLPSSQPQQLTRSSSSSSSLLSRLAMVELKQRILTSLSDRDTYQIAVEDLEKIIQTLTPDGLPMLLNCLYEAFADPKPAVKKESLRLLALVSASHADFTATHLTKIISHIVKRLKDADSGVRDACRDAIGALVAQYLKGESGGDNVGSVVGLFVKPLFEAMGEQNKGQNRNHRRQEREKKEDDDEEKGKIDISHNKCESGSVVCKKGSANFTPLKLLGSNERSS